MKPFDRIILVLLTGGIWAIVALQVMRPAVATTQVADMPLQNVFNQYLTTALNQAKGVANSCRIRGDIHGMQFEAQIAC